MDERNSNYQLTTSRNGLTVPVINGIYLHSVYNPTKEAEAFTKGYETVLKQKNHVLVFGLGFGYHIEQIAKKLFTEHSDYEIVILETSKKLIEDFNTTRPFEDRRISIKFASSIEELFNDWQFVQFLMKKPAIIKHDASFGLSRDFYTQFLSYQAPQSISQYSKLLRANASEWFTEDDSKKCFATYVDEIKKSHGAIDNRTFHALTINAIKNFSSKDA